MAKKLKVSAKNDTQLVSLCLHVDFNYRAESYCQKPLEPGGYYCFEKRVVKNGDSREELIRASYDEIVTFLEHIINHELENECKECTLIPIDHIRVNKAYPGSINVLFSFLMGSLELVSGLKDLYEAIEIIRRVMEAHIKKRLTHKYGNQFDVSVKTVTPLQDNRKRPMEISQNVVAKRDAFFWYLLVSNISLMTIIGYLVYQAVSKMYLG